MNEGPLEGPGAYCARGAWMDPSLYRARVAALKIFTSYTRLLPIGIT